jgi:hypothetical protein
MIFSLSLSLFLYIIRSKEQKRKRKRLLLDLFVVLLWNNKLDYCHGHDQYKSDSITSGRQENKMNIYHLFFIFNGKLVMFYCSYMKKKIENIEITAVSIQKKIILRKIFLTFFFRTPFNFFTMTLKCIP